MLSSRYGDGGDGRGGRGGRGRGGGPGGLGTPPPLLKEHVHIPQLSRCDETNCESS
jgi:hypothetical protein